MKRSRFSDEQVIGILQEHEAGAKCADLCRKHGMSEGTFYAWKSKYSGMSVPDVKRLKTLEDENGKLKKLLAEQMLDAAAMQEWQVTGYTRSQPISHISERVMNRFPRPLSRENMPPWPLITSMVRRVCFQASNCLPPM